MATKFLTNLDLQQNQLKNPVIDVKTSTQINNIAIPVEGQFVYDSTNHKLKVYNGTSWKDASITSDSMTINGTSIALGGSGTVTADAGTLTGTTLNATVVSSSLTSVGTLSSLSTTGDVTVGGDLNVTGAINETTVNNLNVKDLTITVAQGAADKTAANNGGLTIDLGTDGTAKLYYTSVDDRFNFSKSLNATVYGSGANLTSLNADNISSGTVAIARGGTGSATTSANYVFAGPTSGGSGAPSFRTLVAADISAAGAATKYATTITASTTSAITVTHSLNTRDVIVQIYDTVTGNPVNQVFADIAVTGVNTITVTFAVDSGLDYRVVVIG